MASRDVERWSERFAFASALTPDERDRMGRVMQFPILKPGQVAYALEAPCPNYLMCIEGRTRIYKTSDAGREMLLYNVQDGGTCVLTTQCLLSRTNFPAESVAETTTTLAAIPASWFYEFMEEIPAFRTHVLADYTKLLGTMFSFVDSLAFQSIEQRLAPPPPGRGRRDPGGREDAPAARLRHRQRAGDRVPPARRLGAKGLDQQHAR